MTTPICEADLIKKRDILDPFEDDNEIDWKHNPFNVDLIDDERESLEQIISNITFKGSPQLQTKLKALVRVFIDVFDLETGCYQGVTNHRIKPGPSNSKAYTRRSTAEVTLHSLLCSIKCADGWTRGMTYS
jgi:hypothetical protein